MSRQTLELRVKAREELEHRQIDRKCAEKIVSHSRGPMWWLRKWTRTENYQWQEQGLQPVAPFPYKPHPEFSEENLRTLDEYKIPHELTLADPPDYLDVVMGFLLTQRELFIPKSRELMTSWLTVGFITWMCQFIEKTEWVSQSEKELKAQALIKYSNILYRNQEPWMKERHPLARGTEATKSAIEWGNGSRYVALPEGERQLASMHPFGYYSDETCHQASAEATANIVKPACRKMVYVSSVGPGWMWNQVQHV